ncbi:hypothetical protein CAFE_33810 [Caprobacter fermentans]|uniref:DUF2178 domain-containing protein n=1 Tax=Caproicibacter fermentans TaxID=2576756 RepID=A0A6N8I4W4_9FIRM|nr:hypothetical protein [Caproicibacter fermentans]MVB12640.1 hypothetical protein [Caproicibacter fermentans]
MKRRQVWFLLLALAGGALIAAGGFGLTAESQKTISGFCIGIGAAAAVLGVGWFADSLLVSAAETEEVRRIKQIEVNDERNVRIREKAGAKTAKYMNYVLDSFIIVLGVMGAAPYLILTAAGLIAVELILFVYFSNYYSKKM